ncbi:MAG TPA: hypothetical protein VFA75_19335 [Nevskia sp.]|nr:hypothetical protein [Nevskia sp.]
MPERHESAALDGRLVRRVALIGVTVLLLVLGLGYAYWLQLFAPRPPLPVPAPAGPHLQTQAPQDLARLRAAQTARLQRYAWTDRSRGAAQVPITRAMELLAQQGRTLDAGPPEPSP